VIDRTHLQALREADAVRTDGLMREAIDHLVTLQAGAAPANLPAYDTALINLELQEFADWCATLVHPPTWGARERGHWDKLCTALAGAFAAQPQVLVFRNYLPSNLTVAAPGQSPRWVALPQALLGPAGYDVAAWLRDAAIGWDEEREIDWAVRYWEAARKAGIGWSSDFGDCWRAIEFCALQRHVHLLGVLSRRKHPEPELSRLFAYAVKTATRYRDLAPLLPLLEPLRPGLTQQAYG
jgi:N-acetylmuramate 1-kinase